MEMGIQRMREVALGYEFNHIPKALSRLHTERGQFPDGGYLRPGMATTFRGRASNFKGLDLSWLAKSKNTK